MSFTNYILVLVAVSLVAAVLSRKRTVSSMAQEPANQNDDAVRKVRAVFLKTRRRLADLRKERKRIVDEYAKKADELRAAKVRKDIKSL